MGILPILIQCPPLLLNEFVDLLPVFDFSILDPLIRPSYEATITQMANMAFEDSLGHFSIVRTEPRRESRADSEQGGVRYNLRNEAPGGDPHPSICPYEHNGAPG
jgi:hypothetical protein